MLTDAPLTGVPFKAMTLPVTVMAGGTFTVMVALAVRLAPALAVSVAVAVEGTLTGGV